jgi:hypothetical protein
MNGLLVEQNSVQLGVPDWLQDVRREVVALRAEVAELRRENLELRQQVGYWKSRHAAAAARVVKLEAEVTQLRGENRQLQARLYGQRSEQGTARDRSNHLPGEAAAAPPPGPRGQRPGRPGPRRRNYEHLPVVEQWHELPPEDCFCGECGLPLVAHGTEDCEQLEIEVRAYRRRHRRQRYQRTCRCPGPRTLTAPPPPKLIPKSLFAAG